MNEILGLFHKKIGLFIVALLVAAIPLTVFIAQQQQEIRQQAQVAPVTLKLSPESGNLGMDANQSIDIVLEAGSAQISGVDIQLSFTQNNLEVINFQPANAFPAVINNAPNNTNGTFRYVGANSAGTQTGTITIGTLTVKGKAQGAATITFGNTLITSPAQYQGVTTTKQNGTYTVVPTTGGTTGGSGTGQVELYFAQGGTKLTTLEVGQGTFSVDLMLNTKSQNVNAFDTTITFGTDLTLDSVTDGADTPKFPSEAFKTINNQARSLRYSRVSTNTSATNTGTLHIATLNFTGGALGTGTLNFGTTVVTGGSSGSLTIDKFPLSYTITNQPTGGETKVNLTVVLTGIGVDGGNKAPKRPQRQVFLTATDRDNQVIQASGFVRFDPATGHFKGSVTVPGGNLLANTIRVKSKQFLTKLVPGIHNLSGTEITLPPVVLVPGDIKDDNKVDILDYNEIFSCYSTKMNTSSCKDKEVVDLNDDEKVDGVDYNLFVRALSVKEGD